MRKNLLKLLLCIIFLHGFAQQQNGVLRGVIVQAITKQKCGGAIVQLQNDYQTFTTQSDSNGTYAFEALPYGRYTVKITLLGFKSYLGTEIQLIANKEYVYDIELEPNITELKEVEVRESASNQLQLSERSFTNEQSQRTAGVFFDPARYVSAFPGVLSSQDFGNDVVVRGNSPAGVLWRIDGADILNPNHLTNGSTPNERLSPSGGGVNILSGQLMRQTKFYMGAFPAGYSNALSGIFDISLRKGNNKKREYTTQASLIGIDVAAEGPFRKNGSSSYLINYRYSTLGIMALMGIDFGGQTFAFQDLSANLSFPTKKAGHFTLFGFGGVSANVFKIDTTKWNEKTGAERTSFNFYSNMFAVGATHQMPLSSKVYFKSVIAYSQQESDNNSRFYRTPTSFVTRYIDTYQSGLLYASSSVQAKMGIRHVFETGLQYRMQGVEASSFSAKNLYRGSYELYTMMGTTHLLQVFAKDRFALSSQSYIEAGVHAHYLANNGTVAIDPRIQYQITPVTKHSFSVSYAIVSQTQPVAVYFVPNRRGDLPNKGLGFTRAHHINLAHTYQINNVYKLRTELYYQSLFNVPVSKTDSAFSMLNFLQGFAIDTNLINAGTGTNQGVEVSLERTFAKGWSAMISGAVYDTKYRALDGVERNTAFNGRFMTHVLLGKEWSWNGNKERNKVIGVSIRIFANGGLRNTSINEAASSITGVAVLNTKQTNDIQLRNYFRTDLRVYYRINGRRTSQILALDILNLTNYENVAVVFFDPVSNKSVYKPALPFYPNISYRVEF